MKISITIKSSKLPIIYRHRFVSLIKTALKYADVEYMKSLYPEDRHYKVTKPFTFAVLLPRAKKVVKEDFELDGYGHIADTVFYFDKPLNFIVSSADLYFGTMLMLGLNDVRIFDFSKDIKFEIQEVNLLKEKKIKTDFVLVKTLSPLSVEDESNNPVVEDFEKISFCLTEIQGRKFSALFGRSLYEPLRIEPLKSSTVIVKHAISGFKEKPYMLVTCHTGKFVLRGHPDDLNLIQQAGLGLRTGQGFGMLNVIT